MARTTTRGEEKVINISIPEGLHRRIKIQAAKEDKTLKEVLVQAAELFLKMREQHEILEHYSSQPYREFTDDEIKEWLDMDNDGDRL
jgi:hypothetical protein